MARPRLELHQILVDLGINVYNQPPSNDKMRYPCVLYKRAGDESKWADNKRFSHKIRYEVTLITRDPNDALWGSILDLPLCSFERHFVADNLNHDVFNLFF